MINVTDLHKSFGAVQAVRGISFTADDGRIIGLLGPIGGVSSNNIPCGDWRPNRGREAGLARPLGAHDGTSHSARLGLGPYLSSWVSARLGPWPELTDWLSARPSARRKVS